MSRAINADHTSFDIRFDPTVQRMSGYAVHGNTPFDVPFVSQIQGNLWQGGCANGLVLPDHFEHVVSLYKWERYTVRQSLKSFLEVTMYDSTDGPDVRELARIGEWVNECAMDGPTLVHCQAGLNRSSLVAGISLIGESCKDGADIIALIREKRSNACLCNPIFEKILREW